MPASRFSVPYRADTDLVTSARMGICLQGCGGCRGDAQAGEVRQATTATRTTRFEAIHARACMRPRPPLRRGVLIQARWTSGVSVEQASSWRAGGQGGTKHDRGSGRGVRLSRGAVQCTLPAPHAAPPASFSTGQPAPTTPAASHRPPPATDLAVEGLELLGAVAKGAAGGGGGGGEGEGRRVRRWGEHDQLSAAQRNAGQIQFPECAPIRTHRPTHHTAHSR